MEKIPTTVQLFLALGAAFSPKVKLPKNRGRRNGTEQGRLPSPFIPEQRIKMKIGNRSFGRVARAILRREYYYAIFKSFYLYKKPLSVLSRYILEYGEYPCSIDVKTKSGWREIRIYSLYDLKTLNEIFAREDYKCEINNGVVIDFGSNIGISALYFLANRDCKKIYLFEPDPKNVSRLIDQLEGFEDRYVLYDCAVGLQDGEVQFACEPSGRFGGVSNALDSEKFDSKKFQKINVLCRDANKVIKEIFEKENEVSVLKIDVEGLEFEILSYLTNETLKPIKNILVELQGVDFEAPGFTKKTSGGVVHYSKK